MGLFESREDGGTLKLKLLVVAAVLREEGAGVGDEAALGGIVLW